jgi:undecaprenyl-diphosphatase
MNIFQAVLLSIVEGVTEFLPISSTGHLILTSQLLSIAETEFVKSFEIFIQLGAILAVVVLFFNKYRQNLAVWKNVLAAFIPTAIIGFTLYKVVKNYLLGNSMVVICSLVIGGILLIILEKKYREKDQDVSKIEDLTLKQSALIGLAQAVSIIPGVSRSASTILGAMFLGAKRGTAVEFSFLLAVPTMLAATGLDLVKSDLHLTSSEWLIMSVGFLGSFITALLVVKWFLKFIQKNTFIPFGIYRIIIAILFWLVILK